MNRYEVGKEYFLKAMVAEKDLDGQYPLRVVVPVDTPLKSEYTSIRMANVPGILLTAEEVAETRIKELEAECEKYRQSNIALHRTVDALTASEDRSTHRAMLMDALMIILLEKIDEMEKKNNG